MTRKDYVAFAQAFARLYGGIRDDTASLRSFDEMVNTVADVFATDNPRFDYKRFKDAVYGTVEA